MESSGAFCVSTSVIAPVTILDVRDDAALAATLADPRVGVQVRDEARPVRGVGASRSRCDRTSTRAVRERGRVVLRVRADDAAGAAVVVAEQSRRGTPDAAWPLSAHVVPIAAENFPRMR
jgi:hypothetical protein